MSCLSPVFFLMFIAFLSSPVNPGHPNSALYLAALNGDVCAMAKAIASGGTIKQQYSFTQGQTPLKAAVVSGKWSAVNFLLRIGADVNQKNNNSSLGYIRLCQTLQEYT